MPLLGGRQLTNREAGNKGRERADDDIQQMSQTQINQEHHGYK